MCSVSTEIILNELCHLDPDLNHSEGTEGLSAYVSEHLQRSVRPSRFCKSKNNLI